MSATKMRTRADLVRIRVSPSEYDPFTTALSPALERQHTNVDHHKTGARSQYPDQTSSWQTLVVEGGKNRAGKFSVPTGEDRHERPNRAGYQTGERQ